MGLYAAILDDLRARVAGLEARLEDRGAPASTWREFYAAKDGLEAAEFVLEVSRTIQEL